MIGKTNMLSMIVVRPYFNKFINNTKGVQQISPYFYRHDYEMLIVLLPTVYARDIMCIHTMKQQHAIVTYCIFNEKRPKDIQCSLSHLCPFSDLLVTTGH